MNSAIFSALCNLFLFVKQQLSSSKIYGLLTAIHQFFSKSFQNSIIVNLIKGNTDRDYVSQSILCKILRFPITLFEYLTNLLSGFIKKQVDSGIIAGYSKVFFSFAIRLNTRFFGVMCLSVGATSLATAIAFNAKITISILFLIVGLLLSVVNVDLSSYFPKSFIAGFVGDSLGFNHISYSLKSITNNIDGLISAIIIGAATGVLGQRIILLYALPIALFMILLIIKNPVYGVYLTVFTAPILPTMAVVGLCGLTLVSSFIAVARKAPKKLYAGGVGYVLLLFLYILLISSFFSLARTSSLYVFSMYLTFIVFYFILSNSINKKEQLVYVMKVFAISGFLVAVYGVMQYAFGWTTKNAWIDTEMFEEATMRVYSTLKNPNVLGEYLLLALPICAFCFINETKYLWTRIVYGLMFLVTLFCLILTQSRGCWIGFFVSVAIFVTYYKSSLWKLLPFFVILLPLVLPQTIINRFLSVGNMSDSSTSYRVYIWMGTLAFLKHYWFSGIGLGEVAFNQIYPFYSYSAIIAPHSHNLFLQLIVESGIISLVVFAVLIIVFFKTMVDICKEKKQSTEGIIGIALLSGVVGFLVQSMFDYTFYNYRVMGLFFMVLAIGSVAYRLFKKEGQF